MNELAPIIANHPHSRELSTLHETGLITVEQGAALAKATTQVAALVAVSGPLKDGKLPPRHFHRIDRTLAVRVPTAVSQARDLLAAIGSTWEDLSESFHRYREMYMEARLKRAQLNKRAREITDQIGAGTLTGDDVIIAEAETQLDAARIDKLEAEVARGQEALKAGVVSMTDRSVRYQALCSSAGKEAFTTEDFRAEEIDALLKTAWFTAAQAFGASPIYKADGRESIMREIDLPHEILMYFSGLGIDATVVTTEIQQLQLMRENFALSQGARQSFAPLFDNWIAQMARKYRSNAETTIAEHGIDRLKAIQEIVDPPTDRGDDEAHRKRITRRSTLS